MALDLTEDLQQFKRHNDSLSVIDECLMFADYAVIPMKLRKAVLLTTTLRTSWYQPNESYSLRCSVLAQCELWHWKDSQELCPLHESTKNLPRIMESDWTYPKQPW